VSKANKAAGGFRLIPTEEEEQKCLISWCRIREGTYPELGLIYHIPNEGKRSAAAGAAQRAMGLLPGAADLCLPVRRGRYSGLYIELKALDGRIEENQKAFLTAVAEQGFCGCVCYGAEAGMAVIQAYMDGREIRQTGEVLVF
jgi:hypothetical protein